MARSSADRFSKATADVDAGVDAGIAVFVVTAGCVPLVALDDVTDETSALVSNLAFFAVDVAAFTC